MIKGIVMVLLGMLLQVGLARVGPLWPQRDPATAGPADSAGPAPVLAATGEPTPPAPEAGFEVVGPLGFGLGDCGPLGRPALLQAAADALGLTPEALRTALAEGRTLGEVADDQGISREAVAAALKAAALAEHQAQAAARQAQLEAQDFTDWLDRPFGLVGPLVEALPFGEGWPPELGVGGLTLGRGDFGFHFSYRFNDGEPFTFDFDHEAEAFRAAAAGALGLSQEAVAARLAAGETLADLAAAQNVPLAEVHAALKAAMLTAAQGELDAAVADGRLTQAQADQIWEQLEQMGSGAVFSLPGDHPRLREGLPFPWMFEEETDPDY